MTLKPEEKNKLQKSNFMALEEINDSVIITTYIIKTNTTRGFILYEDVYTTQQFIITPSNSYIHYIGISTNGNINVSDKYEDIKKYSYKLIVQYNPNSDFYEPLKNINNNLNIKSEDAFIFGNHFIIYDKSEDKLQKYTEYSFFIPKYSSLKNFKDIQNQINNEEALKQGLKNYLPQQGQPFMITIYLDFINKNQ